MGPAQRHASELARRPVAPPATSSTDHRERQSTVAKALSSDAGAETHDATSCGTMPIERWLRNRYEGIVDTIV